jgi:hypothetical protein
VREITLDFQVREEPSGFGGSSGFERKGQPGTPHERYPPPKEEAEGLRGKSSQAGKKHINLGINV